MHPTSSQTKVAIVGGGLAGLASACVLSNLGYQVSLFEKRPFLGGRASSYEHPATGEVVDNCQHVLFRLCTNLIDFYERIGVADQIRWFDQMNFIEPGGRLSVMRSSVLPAPLHTAPSFWGFSFLNIRDKLSISRALMPLTLSKQRDTGENFQQWLDRHGQSSVAVARFWHPILVSALSEELHRISVPAAAQVIRESMKSPGARQMGVPMIPLTDLYDAAGTYIRERGGALHFRSPVESFSADNAGVRIRARGSGPDATSAELDFNYLILALPFDVLGRILPDTSDSNSLRENISHFENSPITGIHLWFDRQISDLDHAVLLDRTVQWMFHKSRLQPSRTTEGSYIELVVSSSKSLIDKSKAEIVDLAVNEVREFFPTASQANLIKSAVIKELNATYSPRPGIDLHRPSANTAWPRVSLAGDWTATGWPATMEGAVRSGYLAAEALLKTANATSPNFIQSDLPPTGLMRLFS
jgi:squalene-associated FAD-dependent desaturase